jgi:hypothetical protein
VATTEWCRLRRAASDARYQRGASETRRPCTPLLTNGSADIDPGDAPAHIRVEPHASIRRTTERLRAVRTRFRALVRLTHVGASKITHEVIQ